MPRRLQDSTLETRAARQKLKVRGVPYYRAVERGLQLGYRRRANAAGTWLIRHRAEGVYRHEWLAVADDLSDADGANVLDYWQAIDAVRKRITGQGRALEGVRNLTVADAMDRYIALLEGEGRSAHSLADTRSRDRSLIRPTLGKLKVADLTSDKLRRWRDDLARVAPRLRTRSGEKQKHRDIGSDDGKRARRATANRTWTILRAALNHAFNDGKVPSDHAWRKVKPYRSVDTARVRYLIEAEARRLINACDADFRLLVHAALCTGARYGELCRLLVGDFNPDVGTLAIRKSKAGKPRHVVLTDEGKALFGQIALGRSGAQLMLRKADGSAWKMSHQLRPMAEAVERARIKPAISFHGLRHTWASLAIMNGVPSMVVAKNLGHSDTRMVEKHYGHLAPSYVADAIRAGAPQFNFKPDKKIARIP